MRLFRLGRVARALHRFLESSFALLFLMLSFYMVVAHWFACIWYVIGMEDLKTGINFGWLSSLATITKKPFYLGNCQFRQFLRTENPNSVFRCRLECIFPMGVRESSLF